MHPQRKKTLDSRNIIAVFSWNVFKVVPYTSGQIRSAR